MTELEAKKTVSLGLKRLFVNMTRVNHLLQHALTVKQSGRADLARDIVRGVVVLLHATSEEYFKTFARARLLAPGASIDLPAMKTRALSFVMKFRGDSVEKVLEHVVDSYLAKLTINSESDLRDLLKKVRVDTGKPDRDESRIKEMSWATKRRHQIVHSADFLDRDGHHLRGFSMEELNNLRAGIISLQLFAVELAVSALPRDPATKKPKNLPLPEDPDLIAITKAYSEALDSGALLSIHELGDDWRPLGLASLLYPHASTAPSDPSPPSDTRNPAADR